MERGGSVERDVGGGVEGARWECCGWVAGEDEGDGIEGGAGAIDVAVRGSGGELAVVAGGVDAAVLYVSVISFAKKCESCKVATRCQIRGG